jgi:glutathione peroxidase
LAFPCNQFGNQEPGTNEQILELAKGKYGATFPIAEKCDVNGKQCSSVWKYLRLNSELFDKKKKKAKEIPWNFAKFLISGDGQILKYYNPRVDPIGVVADIEKYLSHGCL